MGLELTILLVLIALVGGICVTTIGPGGIFVTIALYQLLALGPGAVAGTASAAYMATALAGSLAYLKSGELRNGPALRTAAVLSISSIAGAWFGAILNTRLDAGTFGAFLGGFVVLVGVVILLRERKLARHLAAGGTAAEDPDLDTWGSRFAMVAVGLGVGIPGGMLGVGGPVLAVPAMIMLGVPMLLSVALAQVQSIFISVFATMGYAAQGVVDWSLALLVGVPLLIGTVIGWWIALRMDAGRLKTGLAVVLVVVGLYLLLAGPPAVA
ncbi:MAG: sulfite exporter TauE/SafE family protein [Gemmatimonadales bacterium]|nr:MAG: sulfite exporter TauE/SafE family protein [Gemmatimonadales bacterium]